MTDLQLYFSIGVPVLANALMFTLLMIHMNTRFDAVNKRVDEVLARLDRIERKLDDHEQRIVRLEERTSPLAGRRG